MNQIWTYIKKVWKDSVWSKVISWAIILLITSIWTRYSEYSFKDIFDFITSALTTPFPLYLTLSIIGLAFLIRFTIRFFKKRPHPIWNEQVGNYSFGELLSVLKNQNFPVRTEGMRYSGQQAPKESLLELFMSYAPIINMGVDLDKPHNDGGFLFGVLCPKLVSYGLVTKTVTEKAKLGGIEMIRYDMSELGHKFHSLMEKLADINKKKMKNTTTNNC